MELAPRGRSLASGQRHISRAMQGEASLDVVLVLWLDSGFRSPVLSLRRLSLALVTSEKYIFEIQTCHASFSAFFSPVIAACQGMKCKISLAPWGAAFCSIN